jgi:hypothetical protein
VKSKVISGGDEGVEVFIVSTVMICVDDATEAVGWDVSGSGGVIEAEGNLGGVEEGSIAGVATVDWQAAATIKTRIGIASKRYDRLL